jgi:hypothetical protein
MIYSRVFIGLVGALYVFFGAWALWHPEAITGMTEIQLMTPTAITDGRAVYGGLTTGLGVLFVLAALGRVDLWAGLVTLFLTLVFPVAGRLIGIAFDEGGTAATFRMMRAEVFILALTTIALMLEWRQRRSKIA